MKIYAHVLTSFTKPQNWLFHVVVLLTTAKKWTKVKNARAGRAKLLFLPTKYSNLSRSRCRRRCLCFKDVRAQNVPTYRFFLNLLRRSNQFQRFQVTLLSEGSAPQRCIMYWQYCGTNWNTNYCWTRYSYNATGKPCKNTHYFVFNCLYLKNKLGDPNFLFLKSNQKGMIKLSAQF